MQTTINVVRFWFAGALTLRCVTLSYLSQAAVQELERGQNLSFYWQLAVYLRRNWVKPREANGSRAHTTGNAVSREWQLWVTLRVAELCKSMRLSKYSETCVKPEPRTNVNLSQAEPGPNGNLFLAETAAVSSIQTSNTCMKRNLSTRETLSVRCCSVIGRFHSTFFANSRSVSDFMFCFCVSALGTGL